MANNSREITGKSRESRLQARLATRLDGMVVCDDGISAYNCMILDTSMGGARIKIEEEANLPVRFYLINVRARRGYYATKVWQKHKEAGLQFNASFVLDTSLPNDLLHLYQYWLDCAAGEASNA